MADTLTHRGPDDWGTWVDAERGFALGFRRLAILDLSSAGHQPMVSADGRFTVTLNGEIYNYRELRAELVAAGASFRGTSDTEVLAEAVSRWGAAETIPRLWGMFAVAVWDREQGRLLLARDRLGKKPLYLARARGMLAFGSELKALHALPGFRPSVSRDALALYLRYGYVPAPYTIFEDVTKVEPGCSVTLTAPDAEPIVARYWNALEMSAAAVAAPLELDDAAATEMLHDLLSDSVARRMIADVPLGAFLSGGIDSSLVVALMQESSMHRVRTFTIGFEAQEYNEAEAAAAVARHLGTDHTEHYVTSAETLSLIPELPRLYDEPFADSSQVPTYLVAALARKHVSVALSGDGGDELFAGYTRYRHLDTTLRSIGRLPRVARRGVASAIRSVPVGVLNTAVSSCAWALPKEWRFSVPGDKLHKLAGMLTESGDVLYRSLVSLWQRPQSLVPGSSELCDAFSRVASGSPLERPVDRAMLLDLIGYLPDDILVKVDRATMGVSLEARSPLLDHRVVELAWRLPPAMKWRNGVRKWILRELAYRYVPRALLDRPKQGFGVPIDHWLRGPLRVWAEDLLSEDALRRDGLFDPVPIRAAWKAHLSGEHNEHYRLWTVLMFQAWSEQWLR